jgi:hypothetical protein
MKYTNQATGIWHNGRSLETIVVIFFVMAHIVIPKISAMSFTIDERIIVLKEFIPLTIISHTTILAFG